MLATTPLFSIYWAGHEQLCVGGEVAVASAHGQVYGSGDGHAASLVPPALLAPFLLSAANINPASPLSPLSRPAEAAARRADSAALMVRARIADLLEAQLGRAPQLVSDAAGLPAPVLDVRSVALLYRALASAALASPLGDLRRALLARPGWLGDDDDVAARLMRVNPGRLLARLGADGWLALAVPLGENRGAGIAVKLASSDQPEWAALALQPFLEELELQPLPAPTPPRDVRWHVRPSRLRPAPLDISPLLSERIAVWPGDTPFQRVSSVEPGPPGKDGDPAWRLMVSSVHTTLHAGAHADAPNHVGLESAGIDQVSLDTYRGLCQVIRVQAPRRSALVPGDLEESPLLARRVLFATGSYRDPERFDPDFSALSPELIDWLQAHGVVLVGIDTPSIDLLSSSELDSHRATRHGHGLAILEGLVLDGVEPGLYELVALPLRIEGADASPVRATLWPLR